MNNNQSNPTKSQARYMTAKAAGLCVRCHKARAEDGKALCSACAEKKYAHAHKIALERARAGLCVRCAQPVGPGKELCPDCAEKAREYARNRSARVKAGRLCRVCPAPALEGATMCAKCIERHRKDMSDRRKLLRMAMQLHSQSQKRLPSAKPLPAVRRFRQEPAERVDRLLQLAERTRPWK